MLILGIQSVVVSVPVFDTCHDVSKHDKIAIYCIIHHNDVVNDYTTYEAHEESSWFWTRCFMQEQARRTVRDTSSTRTSIQASPLKLINIQLQILNCAQALGGMHLVDEIPVTEVGGHPGHTISRLKRWVGLGEQLVFRTPDILGTSVFRVTLKMTTCIDGVQNVKVWLPF